MIRKLLKIVPILFIAIALTVNGFLLGAGWMGSQQEPPAGEDLVSLYCMAVADTAAFLGEVRTTSQFHILVDLCAEKVMRERTFFDFPLQHGVEYLIGLYERRSLGGSSQSLHS